MLLTKVISVRVGDREDSSLRLFVTGGSQLGVATEKLGVARKFNVVTF